MQTLYFQLERSKKLKDGSHPIYLVLKLKKKGVEEKRIRYYTGRTAINKHWIGIGQSKRVSAKAPGATNTNSRLNTLWQGADAIITNAKNLKIPLTAEYFRGRFDREVLGMEDAPAKAGKGFYQHLDEFIMNRRGVLQPSTIKTYETLKRSMIDFEEKTGWKITFESINSAFNTLYTKFLIEDSGVLNNTLAKRIATLKAFLREMKSSGENPFDHFERFKATRDTETTLMHFSESELNKLIKHKLTAGTTDAHVRDAFCFACYTGLRFSDWDKIKPENIVKDKDKEGKSISVLQFTMHKVHRTVKVPLGLAALDILKKYSDWRTGENIIPIYTNQETNRTLKDVAEAAGIDEVVREVKKSGAKRIDYINPKHEIVSCHDARNTMATIYLEKGGRPEILQKLLGHSNIKQTMRYVKIVDKAIYSDFAKTQKTGKVLLMKKLA